MDALKPDAFFDSRGFRHRALFTDCRYAWEALPRLALYLEKSLKGNVDGAGVFKEPLPQTVVLWRDTVYRDGFEILGGEVTKGTFRVRIHGEETGDATVLYAGCVLWDRLIHLEPGTVVEPGALVKGPTWIGSRTEIRQGAYIRGKCIVGDRCVVGHTTEMKGSVMLDGAQAGHFAYIGDSVIGNSVNLGAGTKLANLKIKRATVRVRVGDRMLDTELRKLGAVLGDGVETGCNAVTNPGTLLAPGCLALPLTAVAPGYYEPGTVLGAP